LGNTAGLLSITKVRIPTGVLGSALAHLREAGEDGYEGLALLAGTIMGTTAALSHTIIPRQHAMRTPAGLCVMVDAEELHNINVHLYEHQLRLIAQVHSHGEHAYHSDADDRYSVVTALGALSIVVPYFAKQPFSLRHCAVYRLQHHGWIPLNHQQASTLLELTD
jgi:hypothetical protein